MHILVINPNTTASMTQKIGAAAQAAAAPGTTIEAVNPAFGPPSIEGYYDEVFSIPGLLAQMRAAPEADAYVIACFDDTGLDAARCLTTAPVIGIGEAAFHMASLVAYRFSVVTTLSRSISAIEHNLAKYGFRGRCARVRASRMRSKARSSRTAPKRSCWAAQAWPTSPPRCRASTASPSSTASAPR